MAEKAGEDKARAAAAGWFITTNTTKAQGTRRGRRSAVARSAFPSGEIWRVRAAPALPTRDTAL
jgi:hypothetical protein